ASNRAGLVGFFDGGFGRMTKAQTACRPYQRFSSGAVCPKVEGKKAGAVPNRLQDGRGTGIAEKRNYRTVTGIENAGYRIASQDQRTLRHFGREHTGRHSERVDVLGAPEIDIERGCRG